MKRFTRFFCSFLTILLIASVFAGAGAEQAAEAWAEGGIVVDVALEKIGQYMVQEEENTSEDRGEQVQGMLRSLLYNSSPAIQLLPGGYYVVHGGEGINSTGLFDEKGEQMIPFEAAIIRRLNDHSGEDTGRYLAVYYATEQTDDRSKALLYLSDGLWIGGNNPREGDVMYQGYIRFYDLKLMRFVPDVTGEIINSSCGNLLAVEGRSGKKIFDEEGHLITEKMNAGNGYLIHNASAKEVYDASMKLRMTTGQQIQVLSSTSGYLQIYIPEKGYQVIDMDGAPVVPDLFKSIINEKYGIIYARKADNEYVLETTDGRVLAASGKPITCLAAGYYYTEENGSFTLVGYDGVIAENIRRPEGSLQVFDKDTEKDARTMLLSTREYALPFGRGRDLGIGLVGSYSSENHKLGVFNLFTGEQLLPFDYDDVYTSGSLIYAIDGKDCHVYRPRFRYK